MGAKPNPLGNVIAMKGFVRNAPPDLYNGVKARWGWLLERVHDQSGVTTRFVTSLEQEEGDRCKPWLRWNNFEEREYRPCADSNFCKVGRHPSNPIPVCRNAALEATVGEASSEITRVMGNRADFAAARIFAVNVRFRIYPPSKLRSFTVPVNALSAGSKVEKEIDFSEHV